MDEKVPPSLDENDLALFCSALREVISSLGNHVEYEATPEGMLANLDYEIAEVSDAISDHGKYTLSVVRRFIDTNPDVTWDEVRDLMSRVP